jgi:thiol-disulfide isomerase/thioredoxin
MGKQSHKENRKQRYQRRKQAQQKAFLLWGGGLVLIVAALVFIMVKGTSCGVSQIARKGQPLDSFTLTDIDGNKVSLDDYRGKVVLVNFWATWCPPCRAEMPALKAYYEAHKDDGFMLVAVNAGESLSLVRQFAYDFHLPFPVVLDEATCAVSGYGITSFPTSLIVAPDGTLAAIHIGMLDPDMIESLVTPLLGNQ